MRTDISASTLTRFENTDGIRTGVRLKFFKNRMYFEYADLTQTYKASFAQDGAIQAEPIPQDVRYIAGEEDEVDRLLTAYAYTDSRLYLSWTDKAAFKPTFEGDELQTNKAARPAVHTDGINAYVYYLDTETGYIRKATIDTDLVGGSWSAACVSALDDVIEQSDRYCSIHAIGTDDLIVLDVYEGGIRVREVKWVTDAWVTSTWQNRFMHPTHIYDNNEYSDIYACNFSAAVLLNGRVLVYFTGYDGNVLGVERSADGSWTDSFEAIPADLSTFAIANAVVLNSRVHLCGQFQRIDPVGSFSSSFVYCLVVWSDWGRTFSLDRFTLFATGDTEGTGNEDKMGLRYMMAVKGTIPWTIYFSDANRHMHDTAPYFIGAETWTPSTTVPGGSVTKLTGNPSSNWEFALAAGDDLLIDDEYIQKGCVVAIDIGVLQANGTLDYVRVDLAIVSARKASRQNGRRTLQIEAVPYSLWKSTNMTHPFYLEINSKQSLRCGLDSFEWLYNVTEDDTIPTHFIVDFWDKGTLHPMTHAAETDTDVVTDDLTSYYRGLADYPVISALPITAKAYGWSRAGAWTPYTGGDDDYPDDDAAPNDNISVLLHVMHANGVDETIVLSTPDDGSEIFWPQTFDTGDHGRAEGSYPVALVGDVADGLEVGDEIIWAGVRVSSSAEGSEDTVFYVERLEIPEVYMNVIREAGDTWGDVTLPAQQADSHEPFEFNFDADDDGWEFWTYAPLYNGVGSWSGGALHCGAVGGAGGYNGGWYKLFDPLYHYRASPAGNSGVEIDNCSMPGFWGVGLLGSYDRATRYGTSGYDTRSSVDWALANANKGERIYGCYFDAQSDQARWVSHYHATELIQQQLTNCNLTLMVANHYCQYHEPDSHRYKTGMDDFYIFTYGNHDIEMKITYPVDLGSGRLKVKMKLVAVEGGVDYVQLRYQATANNPNLNYETTSNISTFGVGDEAWHTCNRSNNFGTTGYFKLSSQTNSNEKFARWQMLEVAWLSDLGVTTTLWTNTDCPERLLTERDGKSLQKFGIPTIMLATKPYWTFNFQVETFYQVDGIGSRGGVVGLANDGKNYIAARASTLAVELIKVRNGVAEVLESVPRANGTMWWIMLEHKDGTFKIWMKDPTNMVYEEPVLTYEWTEDDGALAIDADLLHVGTYALIDTPWVRIVGFDPKISTHIGVMPGGSFRESGDNGFPSNGALILDGVHYVYSSLISTGGEEIRGPFQCRNTGLGWNYTEDGEDYSGNSLEFTLFEYLTNSVDHEKYTGLIMGGNSKYNWLISETDFHPWIKTGGTKVYLKNRSRHFGDEVTGDYHGYNQKMWITEGFAGLTLSEESDVTHEEGAVAYLDRSGEVTMYVFAASSGHEDATVEDMLDKILQLAGGKAIFPGDTTDSSQALTTSFWEIGT